MRDLLDAALAYAQHRWPVFPCHTWTGRHCTCGKSDCVSPAKHPRTANGVKDASTDEAQIRAWWQRWPSANIGLATGYASGVIVVDVDPRHGGDQSLDDLIAHHSKLPDTVESLTGGGGRHLLFRHPGQLIWNKVSLLPGLDIRGDGGYIIAPPSRHASGMRYEWEVSSRPDVTDLAALPHWLLSLLNHSGYQRAANGHGAAGGDRIPEGQRNAALSSLAGSMRRRGMTAEEIAAALLSVNAHRCNPPLLADEVRRIAESIARYQLGAPIGADEEAQAEREAIQAEAAESHEFACPEMLWQGRFAEVAKRLGERSWDIWAGTFAAIAATAERHISWRYYGPLYGMAYVLVIKPTDTGKRRVTETCRRLLPDGYIVRNAVQSGPGLAPILADIQRDGKGKVLAVRSRPAILVMDEWTTLIRNMGIANSTLMGTVNDLFHTAWPWNVSRSDRPHSGGGDLVIERPTLSGSAIHVMLVSQCRSTTY